VRVVYAYLPSRDHAQPNSQLKFASRVNAIDVIDVIVSVPCRNLASNRARRIALTGARPMFVEFHARENRRYVSRCCPGDAAKRSLNISGTRLESFRSSIARRTWPRRVLSIPIYSSVRIAPERAACFLSLDSLSLSFSRVLGHVEYL